MAEQLLDSEDVSPGTPWVWRATFCEERPPIFAPELAPQLVTDLIAGAGVYAQEAFGVSIPPELAPELEAYLRNQLEQVIENGRNALVTSVGAQLQVYSRAYLLVDLARFGAVLAGAQPPAPLARNAGHPAGANEPLRGVTTAVRQAAHGFYDTIVYLVSPTAAYGQVNPMSEGTSTRVTCASMGKVLMTCLKGNEVLGIYCVPKGSNASECDGGKPFIPVLGKDPNDKTGAQGVGAARFIPEADVLRYTITFENLETASAAAQEVIITDQLDGSMVDLDTFNLGPIAFGDRRVTPPPGLSRYSTSVDLRPGNDLIVAIDAWLEKSTGLVTWHFLSVDPLTGQFTEDPIAGFLPPNVNPPEGDGSVVFTIQPKVTDTPICNQASIIFDVNEAILTPEWCNTIDDTPPSSQVLALAPTQSSPSFTIEWSGTDSGSGVAAYTIFVSENDGPFTPLVSDTTNTSGSFTGEPGMTYAFYSIARDLVGHVEAPPATADAQTVIELANGLPTETATSLATSTPLVTPTDTATEAPTHTVTATATTTATPTITSTETPTHSPTPVPTASPTITETGTPTLAPTNTRVATRTRTATQMPTVTPSSTPPPTPTACGDVDGDGRVTWRDVVAEGLALLFARNDSRYDINRDGRVNSEDLVIVVSQLGRRCTPSSPANRVHGLTSHLGR